MKWMMRYAALACVLACMQMYEESSNLIAQESVRISEPTSGFFCLYEPFMATIGERVAPLVDSIQFQWKDALDKDGGWHNFRAGADTAMPWLVDYGKADFDTVGGYYSFRALAFLRSNLLDCSDPVTLFRDDVAPETRVVALSDGGQFKHVVSSSEYGHDIPEKPIFNVGTKELTVTFQAVDKSVAWGPSPVYNSGLGSICAQNVCVDILADRYGYFSQTWDVSYLPAGEHSWEVSIFDAVGCNATTLIIRFTLK